MLQLAYRLLKTFKNNPINEFFVASGQLFIDQSCETGDVNDLKAEDTMTTLLSNNQVLLDRIVKLSMVATFADFIKSQPKDDRYINFLTALYRQRRYRPTRRACAR